MNTTSRPLGASPVSVGPLGLGCWPLAGMTREGVSREVAVATVRAAIDAGATHLDTAYCYGEHGESEQAVCEAVGGGRDRRQVRDPLETRSRGFTTAASGDRRPTGAVAG